MNYLKEIMAFQELVEIERLTPSEQALWHALMSVANSLGWPQSFTVAVLTLRSKSSLEERTIHRARNRLAQRGIITVKTRGANRAASYSMISIPKLVPDTYTPQMPERLSGSMSDTLSGGLSGTMSDSMSDSMSGSLSALNKLNETKRNETKHSISAKQSESDKDIADRFDRLWGLYPNKRGKPEALKAYRRAIKAGESDEAIADGIQAYVAYIQRMGTEQRFIKHGSTFFNQKAWQDDYSKPVQQPEKVYEEFTGW